MMRNQRRTKAPYTIESIERALTHHGRRGAVDAWHHLTVPSSKWIVTLSGHAPIEDLSDREIWALCCGLAAADRAAQPRVLREIGAAVGPELLRKSRTSNAIRTIAAGGGPVGPWEELDVFCPLCRCRKSGHKSEPNQIDQACSDARCICHDDDWET